MNRIFRMVVCLSVSFAACTLHAASIWYVHTNGSDAANGTSWLTARRTIQAAINLANSNDTVLVSNGVYSTGGLVVDGGDGITNRVAITNAITVKSLNGPQWTIIQGARDPVTTNGDAAVRCVYVGLNATISGFTLTGGATRFTFGHQSGKGGGAWCEPSGVVSNCIITGNSACFRAGGASEGTLNNCALTANEAQYGGGASYSTLNDCLISNNIAFFYGGGVDGGTANRCTFNNNRAGYGGGASAVILNNCLITGNVADDSGGGTCYGAAINCTIVGNTASNVGGGSYIGELTNCIVFYNSAAAAPDLKYILADYTCSPGANGIGNITNAPQFIQESAGNYRLAPQSPCRNTGSNADAPGATDRDGKPRIAGGTVDMGAYEYQDLPTNYWLWAGAITNGKNSYGESALGDGYPNLFKYASGSSADYTDTLAAVTAAQSNGILILRFNRNTNANDLAWRVEGTGSVTNGGWLPVATYIPAVGSWDSNLVEEVGPLNPVQVTIRDQAPPDYSTNRFLRVRVYKIF